MQKKGKAAKKSTAVQKRTAPKNPNKPKSSGARNVQKVPAKQVESGRASRRERV